LIPINTGGSYPDIMCQITNFSIADWVAPSNFVGYDYSLDRTSTTQPITGTVAFPTSPTINYAYQHVAYLYDDSDNFEVCFKWLDNTETVPSNINYIKTIVNSYSANMSFRCLPVSVYN